MGLHARPAAEFVRCARKYRSRILIVRGGAEYSATSILEVLTACVNCGAVLTLAAEGPDAEEALDGLAKLLWEIGQRPEE
jgi:phosphotransferase system HPr (HPr) family protein